MALSVMTIYLYIPVQAKDIVCSNARKGKNIKYRNIRDFLLAEE